MGAVVSMLTKDYVNDQSFLTEGFIANLMDINGKPSEDTSVGE